MQGSVAYYLREQAKQLATLQPSTGSCIPNNSFITTEEQYVSSIASPTFSIAGYN